MTVLVTGATGNIGSRLIPHLLAAGHHVRAIVRTATAGLPAGVEQVKADLLDPKSLAEAVVGISSVVHLAAVLRDPDPSLIQRVNVEGTRNLIDAVRSESPSTRVVMASTSLVYPDDLAWPATESDAVGPVAAYPASKVTAEQELLRSGLAATVLRLGFVYGDGDAHLAHAPRLFEAWGWHPARALHLVHHRDVDAAFLHALGDPGTIGKIINVVDDAPMSAYEIGRIVGAPLAASSEPLANPWAGRLDGTALRRLGLAPSVPTLFHAALTGAL